MLNKIKLTLLLIYGMQHAFAQSHLPPNTAISVPTGGNSWILDARSGAPKQERKVSKRLEDPNEISKTFVRFGNKGNLDIWIEAAIEEGGTLRVAVGQDSKTIALQKAPLGMVFLGNWPEVDSGYNDINLQADGKLVVSKFERILLHGSATAGNNHYVANDEENFFYWGRRGPSVHLKYHVPEDKQLIYYYSEVTVPVGQDILGSFYMANGFDGGYFGMQVNAETERRILFSVWSPFDTDKPEDIPVNQRIQLLKKGEDVYVGEFGNEGSGGQSYLKYDWKAGSTYGFLLKGQPCGDGTTDYTAWFLVPEEGQWRLIASFKRPKTDSYLKGFHSFLENFDPKQGIFGRKVHLANLWVGTMEGIWTPVTKARFTYDNTARMGYRLDYAGGIEGDRFVLQNGGFFNQYTNFGTMFQIRRPMTSPSVNLKALP